MQVLLGPTRAGILKSYLLVLQNVGVVLHPVIPFCINDRNSSLPKYFVLFFIIMRTNILKFL